MGMPKNKENVMTIDPSMEYERMLSYKEKESMWELYKAIFWSIYLLSIAVLLINYVPQWLSMNRFFGWALVLLAMFTIVYGISVTLHRKLMRRYG
jgi:uncharacterized membrane protein